MTPEERAASLARVLEAVAVSHDAGEDGLARFLSLWHMGASPQLLLRGNMLRFLAAHFLFCELEECDAAQRDELNQMLSSLEAATGTSFAEGETQGVTAMRVSMPAEPLRWVHFPLGLYAALAAAQAATHGFLRAAGFSRAQAGVLHYWHRPAASDASAAATPVVLLPGIGIGVAGYVPLMLSVLARDGAAIFVVELPHVAAGRLHGAVPEEADAAASMLAMLARHAPPGAAGPPAARWVAHSYGTFVLAWLLRTPAGVAAVRSAVLLDPVAVLIAFPHTLHGAVYRAPTQAPLAALFARAADAVSTVAGAAAAAGDAVAAAAATAAAVARAAPGAGPGALVASRRARLRLALNYAVTKEAHIALSVQRHTFWPSASLWLDDLPRGCHVTIALSERDSLLPLREVAAYAAATAQRRRDEIDVQLLWMEDHEHGQIALDPTHWPRLAAALAARGSGATEAEEAAPAATAAVAEPAVPRRGRSGGKRGAHAD